MDKRELDDLTNRIISCAVEVHRRLGPGLVDSVYVAALCIELELAGLAYERSQPIEAAYREHQLRGERLDLIVDGMVYVELRSVEQFGPRSRKRILRALQDKGKPVGMLINLNVPMIKDGIRCYRV